MARSRKNSKRQERRSKKTKLEELGDKYTLLKRDVLTIKLQHKTLTEQLLKFIGVMQLLKDKGLITDDEITAYLKRNQESISDSGVQSEETGTNEADDGSEKSDILATSVSGSDPDDVEPRP